MRIKSILILSFFMMAISSQINAADYKVDTGHGYINFEVGHMGFSMISGRFNTYEGSFTWDKSNPGASSANVTIQTGSLDSNHEKRDAHLTSPDFLDAAKHPTATFKSTGYKGDAKGGKLMGDFTLNGVTKPITLDVVYVGEGDDPWGGYRAGFNGSTTLNSSDFNYTSQMFPSSIAITLSMEGIRQ